MRIRNIEILVGLFIASFLSALSQTAQADSVKANNNTALNDPASWVNSTVPGSTDSAIWDSTYVGTANPNNFDVGSSLTFGQVVIGNTGGTGANGNVRLIDGVGVGTNTLTLNGVGGIGINLTANRDLTIGATGANTADSLALVLGASQTWNIPAGRTLTLNGKRGPTFGSNVLTIAGGGTFLYNASNQFATGVGTPSPATSSAGAGVVVNGSTFNISIAAGGGSASYTNWMGANTSLTMAGSSMNMAEVASTGTHKQTWTGLTLNPGASSFTMSARTSSSGIVSYFPTVTRNAGATANFSSANITNGAGNNVQLYGIAGADTFGWATFGTSDFAKANGIAGTSVGVPTYVNDAWATGNNTTVTASSDFSAGPLLTTGTLRFNAAGAFTVTLPTGVNVISTGGILAGATTAANNSTITGGSITSGNSGLSGGTGADLIVHSNSGSTGAVVINSSIVDNGATPIGLTKAGAGELRLGGTNTFTGPSYINAGTVTLTNAQAWAGNSALNFGSNGTAASSGTFSLNGNSITTNGLATTFAGVNAFVQNAGSTAANLTVNVASGTNNYAGTIRDGAGAGGFSLTKTGAGSLILSGSTLSYTGNTTVNNGSLVLTSSVPASSKFVVAGTGILNVSALPSGLTLSSGKNLTGNGTVLGGVTVGAGSVTPGTNGVGTLTVGSLTSTSSSMFNFGITSGNPNNNLINVTSAGSLNLGGGGFNLFDAGTVNDFIGLGTFNLFQYAGSAPSLASLSAASILNPANGLTYAWGLGSSGGNNFVQLTIGGTPAPIGTWNSDASGNWSDAAKWTTIPTPGQVPNGALQTAKFTTALTANRTVTLDGSKTVGVITFGSGNSNFSYNIGPGSGTLTLDNGTSSARIANNSGNNTISAPLAVGASTPSIGVTVANANETLTLSGGIAATTAGLSVTGPGALALQGTNSYSGNTTVGTGGTLQFAAGSLGSGAVTLDNGTLKWGTAASPTNADDISNRTITFANGGATLNTNGNNVTLANAIGNFGAGNFVKSGTGTLTLGGTNTYTGQTTVAGGTLSISADSNLGGGNGTVQVTTSDTASPTVTLTSATLPPGFVVGSALLGQTVTAINGTIVTLSGNANTAIGGDTPVSWRALRILNLNGGTLLATSTFSLQQTNQTGAPTATQNRNILLGVSGGSINVADTMTLTVDGTITGSTTLTKTGPGTLAISNTNNTAPMTVSGGTLTGTNSANGNGGFGTGLITLQGGATLTSTSTGTLIFGNTVTVPAGQTGNISWPAIIRWGDRGAPGALINGAGTLNVTSANGIELNTNFAGFTGNLNLTGAGVLAARINGGQFNTAGLAAAAVDLGGSVNLQATTNSTGNTINIGSLSGSSSTAILGGTTNGAGSPTWSVGGLNTSTTFAGSMQGNASLTKVGTGTLTLAGNSTNTGTTTISAGTLQIGDPTINTGGSGSIGTGALVNNSALVINRTGDLSIPGVISGTGTISHIGAGTTSIGGANTYSGNTTISAGTVNFNNTTGSGTGTSLVTLSGIGGIGGTGFIGSAISINSSNTLAPGSNGVGTLTFNSTLSLAAGSKWNYEFAGFAQPNDLTMVPTANALTINGGGVNLFQTGTTNPFSLNGVYNLIGYNGAIQGAGVGSLSVLNPDPSKSYSFGTAGGFVTLLVTPAGSASKFWNVDANGTWTTGSNWTTGSAPNGAGQAASFGGGGTPITAPRTVTLNANQSVGVLNFNSTNSFTLSGSSTLTLDAPGDAATINDTNGNHTVAVPLAITGDTLVNVLLPSDTLTLSGPISGFAPNFAKVGVGTVVVSGNNTYSALNSVYAGTLRLTGSGKLGDANNTLNMNGGTLDLTTTTQTFGTVNLAGGDISNGTFSTPNLNATGSGTSTISSVISGATFMQVGGTATGKVVLTAANTFNGGLYLNSGTLSVGADSNLGALSNAISLNGGTLEVTGTTFHNFNPTRSINNWISAFDIVDATNTFTINPNGASSGGTLFKQGLGTLAITGTNSFSFSTTSEVRAGTLIISGSTTFATADQQGLAIAPGNGQTAAMVIDAGVQVDVARTIVGGNQANSAGGSATLDVNGTLNSQEWFTVGSAGAGTSTANLNGNSVVNVNGGAVATQMEVADFAGANGVLNIYGNSQLNLYNNANFVLGVQNNGAGNGTVNQNGGKVTFFADPGFTPGSTTAGLRIGNATGRTGTYTYNLNGGELIVPVISGTSGTRVFNFNGGKLTPTADNTNFISGVTAAVQAGGAIINTAGVGGAPVPVNVTIANAITHDATAGAPAIDGGLTVNGDGTVILTGANTFTGNTTVAAGTTLIANNALALQNSKLATFNVGGGLQFSSTVANHAFTIGGFANDSDFSLTDNGSNPLLLSVGGQAVSSTYGGHFGSNVASFTKVGTGTLQLTAANWSYTPGITVNGGLLAINGSATGGAYTVNTGGQLGGTGTIAPAINVASGGFINPGVTIGTLNTTGAVTINAGGALRTELSGSTNDVLNSTGTLSLNTTSIANFSLLTNITKTQFQFANYAGTLGGAGVFGSISFTTAAGVPTPTGASISYAGNHMTLTVSPQSLRGNFNLDGTITAADIPAMLQALTNLPTFQTSHGLTAAEMLALGDFDGSGAITNADIQPMLAYIGGLGLGSGSLDAVPEPSTFVLLGIGAGAALLATRRKQRVIKAR